MSSPEEDQQAISSLDLDHDVRPQDDLFGHVNGQWIARTEIPDDRATHGSFEILRDASEDHVRTIITEAAAEAHEGGDAARIGDLYASFMDTETIDALGAAPLEPLWARVDAVTDVEGFVRLLGELGREGISGAMSMYPWIDKGDPGRYLLHLGQGGLGLPDESYYRVDEHADIRTSYLAHVQRMLTLAGRYTGKEAAAAEDIMALETRLADAHWERSETRDVVKTYNLVDADELRALLPSVSTFMDAMQIQAGRWEEVVVGQPDYLQALTSALHDVDLESWRRWLTWRIVRSNAPYLSGDFVEERFDFYGRTLTGAKVLRERWKRGVGLVEGVLGEAVGRLYVEQHYPPEAEGRMAALVDNLLAAYRERITTLDWMAADTRQEALAKLGTFTPKIGRPVRWRSYEGLEIDAGDLLGNLLRAAAFEMDYELGKLDRPVDRDEWFMTPQTVNAYYNPALNEIVFPAAILQPPFFDFDDDPAYNYGAIGAVIGHEIGHGFDDQGSKYGGDGTLRDWWSDVDREHFDGKAQALIEQYDVFSPRALPDDHTVNGQLTVGENIGDLGGVAVAYHAYRLSLAGKQAPVIEGLTGDQRFFLGWARVWRVASRTEEAIRRLTVDPHSPPEFRVNVVRNIDAFHAAFATGPGDDLWLAPEDRVSIW